MSPGRRRRGSRPGEKYDPWKQAEPDPEPAPKTKAEAARRARTWADWEAAQPEIAGQYGAAVLPLPYQLDWQRNPKAKPPPGFIVVVCLCGATLCRPPDWRGRALRYGHNTEVRPSFTVGDRCGTCHAPYVRGERGGRYVPPDGFALSRCLCHLALERVPYGTWSPPEPCGECGAPFQQVADSDRGYRLELPEAEGWQEYWRERGLEGWAVGSAE